MSISRGCALSTLAAVLAAALPAGSQSVISTHSGVIHFFEGSVYLGDQALEPHLGKFPVVPQGAELHTEDGRAEVLLTPGVFLRMGDRTAIRMVSNDLADTQVELRNGSVMVDSGDPNANTSVTLIYKKWSVHFLQKGVYRIDSDPPRLWVRQGKAEAFAGKDGEPVTVERGNLLPFAGVLVPEPSTNEPLDALNDWAKGRGESIVADNAITAQIDEDPAAQNGDAGDFTYFPMLGVLSPGMGYPGTYSSLYPTQPGFNSIYLPGYTYQPLVLGMAVRGIRTLSPYTPGGVGIYRGISPGIGGISRGVGTFTPTPFPRPGGSLTPISPAPITRAPVGHTVAPHVGMGRR